MSKWFLRLATESKNWHVRRDQEKWEGERIKRKTGHCEINKKLYPKKPQSECHKKRSHEITEIKTRLFLGIFVNFKWQKYHQMFLEDETENTTRDKKKILDFN